MHQLPHTRDVLVLSGGASRGAVQVGMMRALVERGVRPAAYVGTSVGALNSVFLAGAGAASPGDLAERVQQLGRHWTRIQSRDVFPGSHWTRIGHVVRHPASLYSSDGLLRLVRTWAPTHRLEDLPVPVRVVTTRLESSDAVYHDRGDLQTLLLASTALPSIFDPVRLQGEDGPETHVDGGIADLVPVAGAPSLAPSRVFVLDASVPARLRRVRTPIDVLLASLAVSMRVRPTVAMPGVEVVHLTAPDLGVRMHDFSRTAEHIALGYRAACEALGPLGQDHTVAA